MLINKRENVGLKHFDDPKIVLECSDYMEDVYEILMDKTQISKRKILIVSDDLIVSMLTNEKLNPTVTYIFIRSKKINISLVFITKSYFVIKVLPKKIRINPNTTL